MPLQFLTAFRSVLYLPSIARSKRRQHEAQRPDIETTCDPHVETHLDVVGSASPGAGLLSLLDHAHRSIFFELNARDALSLSNTCAFLRARTDVPYFWTEYMKRTEDPHYTGQIADPSMFPYELLPGKLDWTDRELVILRSMRVCASSSGRKGCKVDAEDMGRGQWVCRDGIRRPLCSSCHEQELQLAVRKLSRRERLLDFAFRREGVRPPERVAKRHGAVMTRLSGLLPGQLLAS